MSEDSSAKKKLDLAEVEMGQAEVPLEKLLLSCVQVVVVHRCLDNKVELLLDFGLGFVGVCHCDGQVGVRLDGDLDCIGGTAATQDQVRCSDVDRLIGVCLDCGLGAAKSDISGRYVVCWEFECPQHASNIHE